MAGAGAVFLTIALGAALGRRVGAEWLPAFETVAPPQSLPTWMAWFAVGLGAISFAQLF
ncbi:MAG: hypothetical protein ACI91B_004810 [Planctomycetota bacterium]